MNANEPEAADAATTNESRKGTQSAQRYKSFSLCSLCSLAANSLPEKQRFGTNHETKQKRRAEGLINRSLLRL